MSRRVMVANRHLPWPGQAFVTARPPRAMPDRQASKLDIRGDALSSVHSNKISIVQP